MRWPALLAVFPLIAACAQTGSGESDGSTGDTKVATTSCEYPSGGQSSKVVDPPNSHNVATTGQVTVTVQMSQGNFVLTLDRAKAPCAVHSMESLIQQGFYSDTSCHRLVNQGIFILQCGDPSGQGNGGAGYLVPDELDAAQALCEPSPSADGRCAYLRGTVALAQPDSSASQFFMVYSDSNIEPSYPVIGSIDASGVGVLTMIATQGVNPQASPQPLSPAKIERMVVG